MAGLKESPLHCSARESPPFSVLRQAPLHRRVPGSPSLPGRTVVHLGDAGRREPVQVENVHAILAAAASRFTPQHLDHLFTLVSQSWESASDRYREKLLELIGKIGKDDRSGKTASKILDLLWNLAHLPHVSREMVELALDAHSSILIESYSTKEGERRTYIGKCVEDIRKGVWVVPGFKQLHRFAKGFYKTNYGQKDQHQIAELQRQYDLLRQTCASLTKCHSKALKECEVKGESLGGETLVDGKYSHRECVDIHLKFMAFLLQDGALYVPTKRAFDIWDTLIANPNACDMDRKLAFKWFDVGMGDMELETQTQLFQTRVLKVDPLKLDQAGYQCLRNFFETINLAERKLRKVSSAYHSIIVETPDLTGIDYLWMAALEVRDIKIADELIGNILQISYQGLSPKLKKDVGSLHQRFFDECFKRLDNLQLPTEGEEPVVVTTPSKTGPSTSIMDINLKLQSVERLLLLLERYITVAEENYHFLRHYPPHGACFLGHPITLSISPDQHKSEFKLECHANESILSVRRRIAQTLGVGQEQVQMGISERWLEATDNNRLIHQLKFKEHQNIIVKTNLYARGNETTEGTSQRQSLGQEQEKSLPGVILSRQKAVFDRLEDLCQMSSSSIIFRVRSLLMLIPTDPRPVENMEIFTHTTPQGASEDPQSPASPHTVLRDYFDPAKTTPTRLLYSLEILSSRLIPAGDREVDEGQPQLFRRNFLECGGLKSVINVLQRNALPSDVDLTVRQDCYAIALALARFLLCNQATLSPAQRVPYRQLSLPVSSQSGEGSTGGTSGRRDTGSSEGGAEPMLAETTGDRPKVTKVMSSEDEVARLTIETMSVDDFATMLAYLVRVCWSAAAGQLHLASISDSQPPSPALHHRGNRDTTPTSLTERVAGQEGEGGGAGRSAQLRAGICLKQETDSVSSKNAAIAREALELLVTCLKLRSHLLNMFYTLPHTEDFVIDILLGSPHLQIRLSVVEQLLQLCSVNIAPPPSLSSDSMPVKRAKTSQVESPRHFFVHLLLKRPQSLWDTRLEPKKHGQLVEWERCSEYFEFRAQLLQNLYALDIDSLSVDVHAMLKEELRWLSVSATPATTSYPQWQTLLAGHLRLTLALFTSTNINKQEFGHDLALQLVATFLFPASKMILDSVEPTGIVSVSPHCSQPPSRISAYCLLIELCRGCYDNLVGVAKQLVKLHHHDNPQFAKEWEFQPPVVGRSPCGYVGLKNAGATCYMNSVLQQLYMTKPAREVILSAPESDAEGESILPEVQSVFGHMLESKLQFYAPDNFWKTFKLWGQPVNVREQQDAYDFFCNLTDQIDEHLKKLGLPKVFEEIFGGAYLDQKICRDCEHTYDRQESFLSVSLPVKSRSLQESLKEHVKGEMLEGENAYLCEKCQEKRDTLKRMCFKTLPPVMVVHLKRFDYDWEANRAIKFDDFFEFPWMLDMEPYTAQGIQARDKEEPPLPPQMYDLVGIVVHSGQASAGHYYSFIKEKSYLGSQLDPTIIPEEPEIEEEDSAHLQPSAPPTSGRWLRFNDTKVEQFMMSNAALEAECFGGSYKAKPSDSHSTTPEMRVRYWNAYLLFYEAVNSIKKLSLPRRVSGDSPNPTSPLRPHGGEDKLQQLQALVQKGEKRHLFDDTMPAAIQHKVNEDNLQFMRHRDVYCTEYFDFVRELVYANNMIYLDHSHPEQGHYGVVSIELATNFLLHTYFRTKRNLRGDQDRWVSHMKLLLRECQEACQWFMEKMAADEGKYLKPFLLECTSKEVRHSYSDVLSMAVQSSLGFGCEADRGPVASIVDCVLAMLEKDVVDNCKSCCEYFEFLKNYASYVRE
ncbi:Ubiquitin carboxyl-terminal hydrolase 24, partial [Geodia barretti]